MNLKEFLSEGLDTGQTYKTLANKLNRKGYRTTTGKKFTPANLSLLGHQFFNTKERTDYKIQLPVEKGPSIDPVTVSNPERLYDLVWQAFTMEEKRKAVLSVVQ